MGITVITSLVVFPMIIALILLVTKGEKAKKSLAAISAAVMTAGAITLAVLYFASGEKLFKADLGILSYVAMAIEALLAGVIIYTGVKHKRFLVPVLALIQTVVLIVFQFTKGHGIKVEHNLYVDRFSVIMLVIIAIAGGITAIYAPEYLKRFHEKNQDIADKSNQFCAVIFMSMAAATGFVVCNNAVWMYIFWEIIALAAYYLMGYGKTGKALDNAFRSLTANMLGGAAFVVGIIVLGGIFGTFELSTAVRIGTVYGDMVAIPAAFFCLAALIMAVQLPFSRWLIKSSDSIAPAIAAISTVISINTGAFLVLKLAPVLGMSNFTGIMVMMIGGITFVTASFAAISQTDLWKVISYSTLSVSGIIMICGGLGSAEAVWSGIMLLIFHTFVKLFMVVCAGNKTLEYEGPDTDFIAVFAGSPKAAASMLTAISAMFIAMLELVLLRWATVTSIADTGNIILITVLCFGIGAAILANVKWIGRLALIASMEAYEEETESKLQKTLRVITLGICLLFPVISIFAVEPYIKSAFGGVSAATGIMEIVLGLIIIAFVLLMAGVFFRKKKPFEAMEEHYTDISGVRNVNDDRIAEFFNEKKITITGTISSVVMLIVGMGFIIGTLVSLLGGVA